MKKLFFIALLLLNACLMSYGQLKVLPNGSIQGGQSTGRLKFENTYGNYLILGGTNTVHTHFYTNASSGYYFNKDINIGEGRLIAWQTHLKLYTSSDQRMHINCNTGNVGIGTSYLADASFKLDVNGDIAINHVNINSDKRLKKDIKELEKNTISKLYSLEAKSYKLKKKETSSLKDMTSDTSSITYIETLDTTTLNIGFIAQDLQRYFPELVREREDGYLTVDYVSLIPVLVEALKEQNTKIVELEKALENKNILKPKSAESEILNDYSISEAALKQNQPNPFSDNTFIEYYLPDNTSQATLYIYDLSGTQIKNIRLNEYGDSHVVINGGELNPGRYLYSLIADGKVISTKQMILTN